MRVTVVAVVIMAVCLFVCVTVATSTMRMAMAATAVRVAMSVAVLEGVDADQVDDEAKHRNDKQPFVLHLGWLNQSFDGLRHDEKGDEQQEQAVHKTGQHLSKEKIQLVSVHY